jgi:hypothetical protein
MGSRILAAAFAAALLFFTEQAGASVARYVEYGDVNYKIALSGDCTLNLDIGNSFTGNANTAPRKRSLGLQFQSSCIAEPVTLAQEIFAFNLILRAMRHDGYDLRKFTGMMIGRLHWPEWEERLVDCSFDQFGHDDRKTHATEIYENCDIVREMNAVLAPYGVHAVIDSIEESTDIDFRRLGPYNWGVPKEWLARHQGYGGKATFDGITHLRFVPLR